MTVIVRADDVLRAAGADLAPAGQDRNLDPLAEHLLQPCLDSGPLGGTGRIVEDGFVAGCGNLQGAVRHFS